MYDLTESRGWCEPDRKQHGKWTAKGTMKSLLDIAGMIYLSVI